MSSHDNYFLKHTLGGSYWDLGDKDRGFQTASQAYDDYLRIIRPAEAHRPVLEVPLGGRLFMSSGWNSRNGYTHFGLWRYAIDLLVLDEEGNNISLNAKVYSPVDGTVVNVDETSEMLSHIAIDIGNGLTLGLVHVKPGTVRVAKGEEVKIGMELAEIGTAVHLHLHIFNQEGVSHPFQFKF